MGAKRVLVPLAEGFEEIEVATIVDCLRRAGSDVVLAAVGDKGKSLKGAHNIVFSADAAFSEVEGQGFDAVVLPGGMPGTTNLSECRELADILKMHAGRGAVVGAICAAPTVLGKLGLLDGRRATCYPGCESGLGGAYLGREEVVVDGNIVTSQGPGTAVAFAVKLIEVLEGSETARQVQTQILA